MQPTRCTRCGQPCPNHDIWVEITADIQPPKKPEQLALMYFCSHAHKDEWGEHGMMPEAQL